MLLLLSSYRKDVPVRINLSTEGQDCSLILRRVERCDLEIRDTNVYNLVSTNIAVR